MVAHTYNPSIWEAETGGPKRATRLKPVKQRNKYMHTYTQLVREVLEPNGS